MGIDKQLITVYDIKIVTTVGEGVRIADPLKGGSGELPIRLDVAWALPPNGTRTVLLGEGEFRTPGTHPRNHHSFRGARRVAR